ncbi:MAG: PTS sugar transporter subunit IIA [Acidobacteriota bacterium]
MLATLVTPELVFPDLPGFDTPSVLKALAQRVVERGYYRSVDDLYGKLLEREELGSTGIGSGVAVPHCKVSALDGVVAAVGITAKAIDFGAVDGQPVRLFFLVISPERQPAAHLQCLAAISKWIQGNDPVNRLADLQEPAAIYAALTETQG